MSQNILTLLFSRLMNAFAIFPQQVYGDVRPKIDLMSFCEPSESSGYAADLEARVAVGMAAQEDNASNASEAS